MNKLTEEEVLVLSEEYNLADGHAFRRWNEAEIEIIEKIAQTFHKVDRRDQQIIESNYLNSFFTLSKQSKRAEYFKYFLCFTASTALEVIANYLRINKLSVALIEPCFDNLHDILSRHSISLHSFPENMVEAEGNLFIEYLYGLTADAIFLVTPNNPTGTQISKKNFACLIDYCRKENKILILDTCFRFYLPESKIYDEYQMLADSNVKCILIEDTGKTWPTLELKAPFFSVSSQLADAIGNIYSDFLLHVSPVSVALMTDFLGLPKNSGLGYIHNIVASNRSVLYEEIKGTFLQPVESNYMSVAWLKILTPLKSYQLKEQLSDYGVHILAGNQFFWSNPAQGDSFVRIALNRDPEMFRKAASQLGALCRNLNSSR